VASALLGPEDLAARMGIATAKLLAPRGSAAMSSVPGVQLKGPHHKRWEEFAARK
jgi:hypothetical protein